MFNKNFLKAGLVIAISLSLIEPVLAQATSKPATQPVTQHTQIVNLVGQIKDARTGQALTGVYIRQEEALNATFSDQQGNFQLRLLRGFSSMVRFEAEGYESVALPFSSNQAALIINLQPQLEYTSQLPPAHSGRHVIERPRVLSNQFTAFYQGDYTLFSQKDTYINGLVLNQFGLSADLMLFYPLNFRGRFFRSRMPVDIANFPFQPAFYINREQAKIGAGWMQQWGDKTDFYLGGDILLDHRSPDNRNSQDQQPIPFTGSLLDYEQTRLGFGVNAALGWQITDRFTLIPEASIYPLGVNFIDRNDQKLDYTVAGEVGAKLRFEIAPGAYAVGQYYSQVWLGLGTGAIENNHFFNLGISLDPWTMAEQLL